MSCKRKKKKLRRLEFNLCQDCSCESLLDLVPDHDIVFTNDRERAATAFIERQRGDNPYWAVHLKGNHILSLKVDGVLVDKQTC